MVDCLLHVAKRMMIFLATYEGANPGHPGERNGNLGQQQVTGPLSCCVAAARSAAAATWLQAATGKTSFQDSTRPHTIVCVAYVSRILLLKKTR
jgi:hypothetical protein